MALELKLAKGAVDADLTFIYVDDATGIYPAVATGWDATGVTNPRRIDFALFLYGYQYNKTADDTALTINNTGDPTVVTQWSIDLTKDSYQYFTMLAVPVWVTGVAGNMYFYAVNSKYYTCINTTASDPLTAPADYLEVTDMTLPALLDIPNIYIARLDMVTNYFGKRCLQTQMFKESEDCECDKNNRSEVRPYQKIFSKLYVANILCAQEKFAQADDMLASLSGYCNTLDCTNC